MDSPIAFANSTALKEQCMCYKLMNGKSSGRDRIYIHTYIHTYIHNIDWPSSANTHYLEVVNVQYVQ